MPGTQREPSVDEKCSLGTEGGFLETPTGTGKDWVKSFIVHENEIAATKNNIILLANSYKRE